MGRFASRADAGLEGTPGYKRVTAKPTYRIRGKFATEIQYMEYAVRQGTTAKALEDVKEANEAFIQAQVAGFKREAKSEDPYQADFRAKMRQALKGGLTWREALESYIVWCASRNVEAEDYHIPSGKKFYEYVHEQLALFLGLDGVDSLDEFDLDFSPSLIYTAFIYGTIDVPAKYLA